MKDEIRTYSNDAKLVRQRRTKIYMTAAGLFLKQGYQGTSMRALAKAVGLSVAGLYHYIGTKDDIVHMIMEFTLDREDKVIKNMIEQTQGLPPTDALRESMRLYFSSVDEIQDIHNFHNHVIASLPQEYRQMLFDGQKRFISFFERIIRQGLASGEFVVSNATLVAHNILLLGQTWANRRWFLRERFSLDQYTELQSEFVLKYLTGSNSSGADTPIVSGGKVR